jgi:hypothetical protein
MLLNEQRKGLMKDQEKGRQARNPQNKRPSDSSVALSICSLQAESQGKMKNLVHQNQELAEKMQGEADQETREKMQSEERNGRLIHKSKKKGMGGKPKKKKKKKGKMEEEDNKVLDASQWQIISGTWMDEKKA